MTGAERKEMEMDELMIELAARASRNLARSPKLRSSLNMRANTGDELDAKRVEFEAKWGRKPTV